MSTDASDNHNTLVLPKGRHVVPLTDVSLFEAVRRGWSPSDPATAGREGTVFGNAAYGQVVHVITVDVDENGNIKPVFDSILRVEKGGGVFAPIRLVNRRVEIGTIKAWRPVLASLEDLAEWQAAWPNVGPLIPRLGRESIEFPRGFASLEDRSGKETALREGEEEIGSVIVAADSLGNMSDNTASSPHLTALTWGLVDESRRTSLQGDPNEKLVAPLKWHPLDNFIDLIEDGEIIDGFTLAGFARLQARGLTTRRLPVLPR